MITEEWCDAAARFPDNNPRYKVQDGTFAIGGRTVFDNPLHSSRMVHAHALGLTGAGEVIVVVDAGFRMAHEAFAGKSNTRTGNPGVDDHGTMVASIAAGSAAPVFDDGISAAALRLSAGTLRPRAGA